MCTNKVRVFDHTHLRKDFSYFPCGQCVSCRQVAASRRAKKIRNHHVPGFVAYFVTLTYKNSCIPYVRREDLFDASRDLLEAGEGVLPVPIYRDSMYERSFGEVTVVSSPNTYLCDFELTSPFSLASLSLESEFDLIDCSRGHKRSFFNSLLPNSLNGIRYKLSNGRFRYDDSKISIAYPADFQKFVKRLRTNCKRTYGWYVLQHYYYAPEYGHDAHRFHHHAILYFPDSFSLDEVQSIVYKAWPFGDPDRCTVEVAWDPAGYLASYVTKSPDISPDLYHFSPTRSSHSFHYGFNEGLFDFQEIVKKFYFNRTLTYPSTTLDRDGRVQEADVLYPQYVTRRYFPLPKGYNRLTSSTLYNVIVNYEKYSQFLFPTSFYTPSGKRLYRSRIIDVYGNAVLFTKDEFNYYFNSLRRSIDLFKNVKIPIKVGEKIVDKYFFRDLHNVADFILSFHRARSSYIYQHSQLFINPLDNVLQFFNLPSLFVNDFAPTVTPFLDTYSSFDVSCNVLPDEQAYTRLYEDMYYKRQRQYALNKLDS